MSTVLRIAALFTVLVTVALWFFGGFNFGRTQWTVPVEHLGDDGRPRIVHEARFLPGLDFLLGGGLVGLALLGLGRWRSGAAPASAPGPNPPPPHRAAPPA